MKSLSAILLLFIVLTSCTSEAKQTTTSDFETVQDSTSILFTVKGLSGPEAVRYDEPKMYFSSLILWRSSDLIPMFITQ